MWLRVVLIVAAIGFVLGIYLSYRAQPDLLSNPNWGPLIAVAVIGVPVTVALNMLEFQASAKLVGLRFSLVQAAEITIIGSVANMLPIPGGTMVRVAALKAAGTTVKRGTAVTLLVSGLWIGIAFLYSGLWLGVSSYQLALLFLAIGIAALAVCIFLSAKLATDQSVMTRLLIIKTGLVFVDAARIYGCLHALGHLALFSQASVLTVSSVMGAAVSIVPAGLGVREGVAALLAPIVALPAAAAYLAASLNRIIGLLITTPVALFFGLQSKRGAVKPSE